MLVANGFATGSPATLRLAQARAAGRAGLGGAVTRPIQPVLRESSGAKDAPSSSPCDGCCRLALGDLVCAAAGPEEHCRRN